MFPRVRYTRFMPYRQMAWLLSYSAIAKSGTGNHAAALQDLAAIEIISKHVKSYPTLNIIDA